MHRYPLLFWQPHPDYLKLLSAYPFGKKILIVLNYAIWLFLFYVSYRLIRSSPNFFGQILLATVVSEVIERWLKNKIYWKRPMFVRHDSTPTGLVDKWYKTGSFPSGHTIKATFFFLFILQSQVINPTAYLGITGFLILFRVVIGFHYPIDILGGMVIGLVAWMPVHLIHFPMVFNNIIKLVFNFVFFIK